jgi:hypothetical protein
MSFGLAHWASSYFTMKSCIGHDLTHPCDGGSWSSRTLRRLTGESSVISMQSMDRSPGDDCEISMLYVFAWTNENGVLWVWSFSTYLIDCLREITYLYLLLKFFPPTVLEHRHVWIKKNSVAWVRKQTIPTERPLLIGEASANFCG